MARKETIDEMLTFKKRDLNLFKNERRLILLAVIKANFNLKEAYKINNPKHISQDSYIRKYYRYNVKLKEFKKWYKQRQK